MMIVVLGLLLLVNASIIVYIMNLKAKIKQLQSDNEKLIIGNTRNSIIFRNIFYLERISDEQFRAFVQQQGIESMGIYGLGLVGKKIIDKMVKADMPFPMVLDRNDKLQYKGVKVFSVENIMLRDNKVDIILVTPEQDFDIIRKKLREIFNCPIVKCSDFLEEIVFLQERDAG